MTIALYGSPPFGPWRHPGLGPEDGLPVIPTMPAPAVPPTAYPPPADARREQDVVDVFLRISALSELQGKDPRILALAVVVLQGYADKHDDAGIRDVAAVLARVARKDGV